MRRMFAHMDLLLTRGTSLPPASSQGVHLVAKSVLLNWVEHVAEQGAAYLIIVRMADFSYYAVLKKILCAFWD